MLWVADLATNETMSLQKVHQNELSLGSNNMDLAKTKKIEKQQLQFSRNAVDSRL